MDRYALYGTTSKELLSYDGAVIWHDNAKELEFLFDKELARGTLQIRKLGQQLPLGQRVIPFKELPQNRMLRFPLRKEDFR